MLPTVNLKDPIASIILKQDFDWRFVHNNPVLMRPTGTKVFVACTLLINDVSSRIIIIRSNGKYYMICQLDIELDREETRRNHGRLIEYHRRHFLNETYKITDLDNPQFNCEWHFPIEHDGWLTIVEELKKIQVPVMPEIERFSDIRRAIWIKETVDFTSIWWSFDKPHMEPLKIVMDKLLNYALIKVHKAYLIPKND
jgi:hypothetical protein